MNYKGSNKRQAALQTVLVAGTNTTPTGSLVDGTTAYNITNGQIAVLSFDLEGSPAMGAYMTLAGAGASTNNMVKLVQGTPKSAAIHTADVWEVGDKALVETDIIHIDRIFDYTETVASVGQLAAQVRTGFSTVSAGKTYGGFVFLNSVRGDRDHGDNDEVIQFEFTTPASLAGITDTTDYLLQKLIANLNLRSRLVSYSDGADVRRGNKDYVVLGFNSTSDGAYAGAGTAINDVTEGTSIDIFKDGDVTTSLPVTNELVVTLAKLVDNGDITGTATIELVDASTAGDAALIDSFLVLGLDHEVAAYFDDIAQVRTQVGLTLTEQFDLDGGYTSASVRGEEAVGNARRETISARDNFQLRVHTKQNHPHGEFFSEGKTYIDPDAWYNRATISFWDYEETLTTRPRYEKKAVVLWTATPATGTDVSTAVTALGGSNPPIVFTATEPAALAIFEAWKNR